MRSLFPHRLFSQQLFCRRCQSVVDHGIYARETYSTYGGLDSGVPLLCSCGQCGCIFVAFSHEFSFCRDKMKMGDYTKIHGKNRITPGYWLYFEGDAKPGLVKSCFQNMTKDVVIISYDGGPDQKIECDRVDIHKEDASEGYKLLPAQSAQTLIGDHVYHAIRKSYGIAVGLVNDGEKDLLVVHLDDGTLLFLKLPPTSQNLPNERLSAIVRSKLGQLFPNDVKGISITAGQGVIYMDGLVRNLAIKRALKGCVESLPKVRGCVDFMRVAANSVITDEMIENDIMSILETPGAQVFDYNVEVHGGCAVVHASCVEEMYPKDLENRIAEYPGIQDLSFYLETIPEYCMENRNVCHEIEENLQMSSLLNGARIKVSFARNHYLLEGRVTSGFQKKLASFTAMKIASTPSIENKLRIVLK